MAKRRRLLRASTVARARAAGTGEMTLYQVRRRAPAWKKATSERSSKTPSSPSAFMKTRPLAPTRTLRSLTTEVTCAHLFKKETGKKAFRTRKVEDLSLGFDFATLS